MRYDGSNELHALQARAKLEKLIKDKKIFDLTEKKPPRSFQSNKYLHVCLSYFGCRRGETLDYVKTYYYKTLCNPDIFFVKRKDKYLGRVTLLRSSSTLNSAELALSIERFRNWSASVADVYIPSPNEVRLIQLMELEIERHKEFILGNEHHKQFFLEDE